MNHSSPLFKVSLNQIFGSITPIFLKVLFCYTFTGYFLTSLIIFKAGYSFYDISDAQHILFNLSGIFISLIISFFFDLAVSDSHIKWLSEEVRSDESIKSYKQGFVLSTSILVISSLINFILGGYAFWSVSCYAFCGIIMFGSAIFIFSNASVNERLVFRLVFLIFLTFAGFMGSIAINPIMFQ